MIDDNYYYMYIRGVLEIGLIVARTLGCCNIVIDRRV